MKYLSWILALIATYLIAFHGRDADRVTTIPD